MSKSKIFLLLSLVFLLGNLLYLLYFEESKNTNFKYDSFYTFRALVKDTDKKLSSWHLVVEPIDLANYESRILVYNPLYPEYEYGDLLEISCKIYQPTVIKDKNAKIFHYDKYLAKDDIWGTCFRPSINKIGQQKDAAFYLYKFRNYAWSRFNDYLVEPASSLAKAMLLAKRGEILEEDRLSFSKVGLSHIVAISGLHIAIIVFLLQTFLFGLGLSRKKSILFLFVILIIYLFIIAFPSSAVRASLMIGFLLIGPFISRDTQSIYSLVLSADIFILLNPYVLLYDIGFQLSFLAVLGLIYYIDFFKKIFSFVPDKLKLREVLAVTMAAQVFTWPVIVYNFGILSLVAPLANFLVLPLLPAVLVLSMCLALFGFWDILASIFAWPLFIILKVVVYIANYLASWNFSYLEIGNFSLSMMLFSLIFISLLTLIIKPKDYV